mmetsp:Transcript_141473/g.359334  ORF Transcript_141473/g.359334 Transcript_141473/m.359334 type:complete len:106 (-) Transcript_141473:129-446(-)
MPHEDEEGSCSLTTSTSGTKDGLAQGKSSNSWWAEIIWALVAIAIQTNTLPIACTHGRHQQLCKHLNLRGQLLCKCCSSFQAAECCPSEGLLLSNPLQAAGFTVT